MSDNQQLGWTEHELQFAILQLLLAARRKNPRSGGASALELAKLLHLDNLADVEVAIRVLSEKNLVEAGLGEFRVTALGYDYLLEGLTPATLELDQSPPDQPPPFSGDPPWSPGDPPDPWGPRRGPDDPSRVPLRPSPSSGNGELALRLPDLTRLVD